MCNLSCVSKSNGFDIIGASDCQDTETISYSVSSACSGEAFLSGSMSKASFTEIVNPEPEVVLILGYRL